MLNKNSTKQNSTDPYEYFIIDNFLDINTYTQMRKDNHICCLAVKSDYVNS